VGLASMGPPLVNGGNIKGVKEYWRRGTSFNGAAVSERRKSRGGRRRRKA